MKHPFDFMGNSVRLIWQCRTISGIVGVKDDARTPESTALTKPPGLSGNHPKLI